MASKFDLDTPLLQLSKHDVFTLQDATAAVHVWGATGGGKSSGSGNALRNAYLRAGMGGIVLVAKPSEVDAWLKAARAHGRSDSVIVFDEKQGGFNFIAHELARHGPEGINNVIECLMRVLEFADQASASNGGKSDQFWADTTRQILTHTIPLLYAAYGTASVAMVLDFVYSAATRSEQYSDDAWTQTSFAAQTLQRVAEDREVTADVNRCARYWLEKYPAITERTRSNIVISLCSRLDRLNGGRLQRIFCDRTTVVPEMTFHGAIILMNMPALTWNEDGIFGQMLMKYLWQRAVLSRNALAREHRERFTFLWADESQYFVNEKDDDFLSTCRDSRACVVYLSQTISGYYARFGKDKTDAADGLVGRFGTVIFHQNSDPRTNEFAAKLIGRDWQRRRSGSVSDGVNYGKGMNMGSSTNYGETSGSSYGHGGVSSNSGSTSGSGDSHGDNVNKGLSKNTTDGWTEQLEFLYEPRFFATKLKSGGKRNGNRVTAVWFRSGGDFVDGGRGNTLITGFQQ